MAGPKDIRAGGGFVELGVKDFLDAHLKRAGAKLKAFGSSVAGIGAAVSAAGTAALAPLVGAVGKFTAAGAALSKLSTQTGVAVEDLSRLQFAAEQLGIDRDDLTGAIEELQIRLGEAVQDGTGPLAESFRKLGLNAEELVKLPVAERMAAIGDALARLGATDRQFLADEIFGGDAFKILPLLQQGAEGIKALADESDRLGATLTTQDAKAAADIAQAWRSLRAAVGGAVTQIGAALAPAIQTVVDLVRPLVSSIAAWIRENRGLAVSVAGVAAAVVAAGAGLTAFGLTIAAAGVALSGIATLVGALLSPLGLLVGAAAAAGTALVRTGAAQPILSNLASQFEAIRARVVEVGGAVVNAFKAGDFALVGEILKTGLAVAFTAARNRILEIWTDIVSQMKEVWFGLVEEIAVAIARSAAAIDELRKKPGEALKGAADVSRTGVASIFTPEGQAKIAAEEREPSAGEKAEAAIREQFKADRLERKAEQQKGTSERERQLREQTAALEAALAQAAALPGSEASPAVEAAVMAAEAATTAVERTAELPQALERGSLEAARQADQNQRNRDAAMLDKMDSLIRKSDDLKRAVEESGVVRVAGAV